MLKALEAFVVDKMNDANQKLLYKLKVNETNKVGGAVAIAVGSGLTPGCNDAMTYV